MAACYMLATYTCEVILMEHQDRGIRCHRPKMSWGCLQPGLSCAGHSARALAGSKDIYDTALEPPAVLSVSENRTRAGPPKSGFPGFEGLRAVNSRRGLGWCARGIDGEI